MDSDSASCGLPGLTIHAEIASIKLLNKTVISPCSSAPKYSNLPQQSKPQHQSALLLLLSGIAVAGAPSDGGLCDAHLAAIGQLKQLKQLHLTNNRLRELPASLRHLTHLAHLDLRNNHLAALPRTLPRLKRLRVLDLRANRLIGLPAHLSQLKKLQKLDLRWNKITDSPADFAELEKRGCAVYL